MADEIYIDGQEEHAFRRSIEAMLRRGEADEAAGKLKALLTPCAGHGGPLPERMLHVTAADIDLTGWDELAQRICEYDRPENRITALGVGIADPEDWGVCPDEEGRLTPPLETTYFSDAAYPFSEADREDLLEGYSSFGCEWQGDFDHTDKVLKVEGIDDLYGAIAELENSVSQSASPSPRDIEAGAIGACYLGVLVYQAMRATILDKGLPRPLTVLLVNSDAYPFFDAPVMSRDEYEETGPVHTDVKPAREAYDEDGEPVDEDDDAAFASLGSLLGTPGQKAKKKMVLVLEGDEAANPLGMEDAEVAQAAFEASALANGDDFAGLDFSDAAFEAAPADGGFSGFPQDHGAHSHENDEGGAAGRAFREDESPVEDDLPAAGGEAAFPRKAPIDFDTPFNNNAPIDFGSPLTDRPEKEEQEPAPPKENWLEDWREITQKPFEADEKAQGDEPVAGPREAWLDDWREVTDEPEEPAREASGGEADDDSRESWLDDWREITDRPDPVVAESTMGEPLPPAIPAAGDTAQPCEPETSLDPEPENGGQYDFNRLEAEIGASLPEDFYEDAPVPGDPRFDSPMDAPASHSIRNRIRMAAVEQEEQQARFNPLEWIVNLVKRVQRWISRS